MSPRTSGMRARSSLFVPPVSGRRPTSTSIDVIEAFILRDQGQGVELDDDVGTREGEVVGDEVEGSYAGQRLCVSVCLCVLAGVGRGAREWRGVACGRREILVSRVRCKMVIGCATLWPEPVAVGVKGLLTTSQRRVMRVSSLLWCACICVCP